MSESWSINTKIAVKLLTRDEWVPSEFDPADAIRLIPMYALHLSFTLAHAQNTRECGKERVILRVAYNMQ
jgi:hypothetical protein